MLVTVDPNNLGQLRGVNSDNSVLGVIMTQYWCPSEYKNPYGRRNKAVKMRISKESGGRLRMVSSLPATTFAISTA